MTHSRAARRRTALIMVAAASVAAAVSTLARPPDRAFACSCAGGDVAQMAEYADAVFLGRVVSVTAERPDLQEVLDAFAGGPEDAAQLSGWGAVATTFEVEHVFKGDVAAEAVVHSDAMGASCGYVYGPGLRYVVFAGVVGAEDSPPLTDEDIATVRADPYEARDLLEVLRTMAPGTMTTSLCSGNFVHTGEAQALSQQLGPGGAPVPAGTATAAGAQAATADAARGWSYSAVATALAAPADEATSTPEPIPSVAAQSPTVPGDGGGGAPGTSTTTLVGLGVALAGLLLSTVWYWARANRR